MIHYSALIIDIKNSRKYEGKDRGSIQNYIKASISALNNIFRSALKFEIIFSAGDEVQGLFTNPSAAFLYYRLLDLLIAPVETRAGIGIGDWDVKIDGGTSSEQDGSAYHNARLAINSADDKDGYDFLINSGNENDIFVNAFFNTSSLLMNQQTEKQNQLMLLIELMYPIVKTDSMDINFLSSLSDLLFQKSTFEFFAKWKWPITSNKTSLIKEIDSYCVSNNSFHYAGKIKGLSLQLANMTGATRQNIEKILKAGNVNQIRDIHIVTLRMMDKVYSGGGL